MQVRHTCHFGFVPALAWAVLLFLFLPIFMSVPFSFSPEHYLSLPTDSISWRHYVTLFKSQKWLYSIGQSLLIASCSAAIAVILGTLCAVGLWRIASRLSETIRWFMLMPIIVPPIVSALAFYRIWVDLRLFDSYTATIISHAILGVPYVVITVSTSLAHFDLKLELAARNLGASTWSTLRHVILPSITPGVLAGAVFAFIWSWDEIVIVLFITSIRVITVPRRMWEGIKEQADPTIAAFATLLIALTVFAIIMYIFFRKRTKDSKEE